MRLERIVTGQMKSSNALSILDLEHSVVIKILGWLSGADLGRISCVSSFFSSEQPDHINRLSLVEEASRDSANKIVKDIYLGTQLLGKYRTDYLTLLSFLAILLIPLIF